MEVDLRERLAVGHSLATSGARRLDAVGQQEQRLPWAPHLRRCGHRCCWETTSREAPRGSEGPEVDHRSGSRLGGPAAGGTLGRSCLSGFEPMTLRQLHSVTVSAGTRPRCSARGSVSTPGGCSRGLSSASRHRVDISHGEDAVRSALSTLESPAHRWRDPVQWIRRMHCNGQRVVQCRLPRVASCRLRLSRAGCDLLPPSR